MSNEKNVDSDAISTRIPVDKKNEMGSGEWMRIQLMKGWDTPKVGMLPDAMVSHVLKEWGTGKTKINDLYFQANKLRKDESTAKKYADLKIRDYVKRIEDATGITEKKAQEQKAKDEVKAKEKAEKAKKAEADVKKAEADAKTAEEKKAA